MLPHEKLLGRWRSEGSVRVRSSSPDDVAGLEIKCGVRLPDDFRAYLLNACPASDDEMDAQATLWWDIDRIRTIEEEYEHPVNDPTVRALVRESLFFADFMLWSMAWAIVCAEGEHHGRVVVFSAEERFVADSFAEFVDAYLRDVNSVL